MRFSLGWTGPLGTLKNPKTSPERAMTDPQRARRTVGAAWPAGLLRNLVAAQVARPTGGAAVGLRREGRPAPTALDHDLQPVAGEQSGEDGTNAHVSVDAPRRGNGTDDAQGVKTAVVGW